MVDRGAGDRGRVVDKGSQSEGERSRMLFTGSNKRGEKVGYYLTTATTIATNTTAGCYSLVLTRERRIEATLSKHYCYQPQIPPMPLSVQPPPQLNRSLLVVTPTFIITITIATTTTTTITIITPHACDMSQSRKQERK